MPRTNIILHPRLPLLAALAAMLLAAPALFVGLQVDDYLQRAMLLQHARPDIAAMPGRG